MVYVTVCIRLQEWEPRHSLGDRQKIKLKFPADYGDIYINKAHKTGNRKMINGRNILLAAMVTMIVYGGLQVVSMVLDLGTKIAAMGAL